MNFVSRRAVSGLFAAGACATALALAAPAGAATLTAERAVDEACSTGDRSGEPGVATDTVSVPGTSIVSATMSGAEGNWDLAVVDADSGDVVAASSYADGNEVAQGFAAGAGDILVQACRRTGDDPTAEISVDTTELTQEAPPLQIVRVSTPDEAVENALGSTGLDVTERGGPGYVDVLLHNPAESALLADEGFHFTVVEPDLLASSLADRTAERRVARAGGGSGLPSGAAGPNDGTYRRLFDYSEELQQLADDNPKLVKYFTLKKKTYENRPVEAITVGANVRKKDGRPAFLLMGEHHAREWPSAEHTIEFAYQLINGYNDGNKKIRKLLRRTRVTFVPVVNPDGFNTSREAGETGGASGGRPAPGGEEAANLVIPYEYQRKNCRITPPQEPAEGDCTQQPAAGLAQFGVDPNRNYGGFWGGPGASTEDTMPFGVNAQDYRGPGPFSEPETQNVRKLVSKDQVVTLITNHTFSNLLLRPPGLQSKGPPPDEKLYKRFGKSMANENGYTNQKSYELYDTSGTTEDWSYYATGGLGFTFEIGATAFHDTFADGVVAEYNGTSAASGDGGGNRVAYMKALKSTANPKRHSQIKGTAPAGAALTLKKTFKTPTSPVIDGDGNEGKIIYFRDRLKSKLDVGKSGRYDWHVNPSTRPLVDPRQPAAETKRGKPSDPVAFAGTIAGATPCADAETEDPACFNDHPFKVPAGKGIDNGKATVRVTWATPSSDWDIKVFKDTDGDGTSEGETRVFGSSAQGPTNVEETTIAGPDFKPGKYVVRVTNFAAVEPYKGTVTFNKTEAPKIDIGLEKWTLTCREHKGGPVKATRKVLVKRGQVATTNLAQACS